MKLAPIVLFTFNRPQHTMRTVKALLRNAEAAHSDLHVFSDGPKLSSDVPQVDAVRTFVGDLADQGQFGSVTVYESDHNRGLAKSVIQGVTQVIDNSGKVIVLEDDLETSSDFLRYMNQCLAFYEDDNRVGSVTGYSPLSTLPAGYPHDVYVAPRNCSLGWGTWQGRWSQVDWSCKDFDRLREHPFRRRRFNSCGTDRYSRLRREVEDGAGSWSIRFGLWLFLSEMHTVYPRQNRVLNIGDDGTGVHDSTGAVYTSLSENVVDAVMSRPPCDPRIVRMLRRKYSPTISRRLRRLAERIFGVGKPKAG